MKYTTGDHVQTTDTKKHLIKNKIQKNGSKRHFQKMFCSGCGNLCIPNAKFCHLCGKEVLSDEKEMATTYTSSTFPCSSTRNTSSTTSNTVTGVRTSFQSFDSFRARKAEDRSRFFKTKCPAKAKKAKVEQQPSEVKINIGVLLLKDGKLAVRRGATLPLTVAPSVGSHELLRRAVEKHSRFNQNLVDPSKTYRLLHADHEEVNTIPGTEKQFTLKQYKEEIDKPYLRITFFLCPSLDFLTSKFNCDDSSDEELQYTMYKYTTKQVSKENEQGIPSDGKVDVVNMEQECAQSVFDVSTKAAEVAHCPEKISEDDSGDLLVSSQKQQHVQCPICLENYPLSQIETHADNCSMWLLEDDDFPNDALEEPADDITIEIPPLTDSVRAMHVLKQEVSQVAEAVLSDEPKRLTIRRKFMWQDFKNAREKKIKPKDKLKVVFSGEPAIDDGGPRRELFSGMNIYCDHQVINVFDACTIVFRNC